MRYETKIISTDRNEFRNLIKSSVFIYYLKYQFYPHFIEIMHISIWLEFSSSLHDIPTFNHSGSTGSN